MDKYYVPKYLDEPYKVATLTLDELAAICIPVFTNLLTTGGVIMGILLGTILVVTFKKIKGKEGHRELLRVIYWYLPQIIRFRSTPPSYIREILG